MKTYEGVDVQFNTNFSSFTVMLGAAPISETSVIIYQTTWRHIPEDRSRENSKSCTCQPTLNVASVMPTSDVRKILMLI
jgi:hypothetical protein